MGLGKYVASAGAAVALGFAPDVAAETPIHNQHHLALGVEAHSHAGLTQAKYIRSLPGHFETGVVGGIGMSTHKDFLASLEVLGAYSVHFSDRIGVVLEGTVGVEVVKGGHGTHVEPAFKGALFGEYQAHDHVKVYGGPYVGRIGHDNQVGGAAGVIFDL